MVHLNLSPAGENAVSLELTPDDLDGPPPAQRIVLTLQTRTARLEALHSEQATVEHITLSHAQMGLLVNAWIAYTALARDQLLQSGPATSVCQPVVRPSHAAGKALDHER